MLHGFGKRLGRRDDALLEVPESACGTDRDVEDAMACRAIRECAFDEFGRVRVDLDPDAPCRVDARYVGVGNRAREELLVAPAIRISLFECRSAGVCRTVGVYPHAVSNAANRISAWVSVRSSLYFARAIMLTMIPVMGASVIFGPFATHSNARGVSRAPFQFFVAYVPMRKILTVHPNVNYSSRKIISKKYIFPELS